MWNSITRFNLTIEILIFSSALMGRIAWIVTPVSISQLRFLSFQVQDFLLYHVYLSSCFNLTIEILIFSRTDDEFDDGTLTEFQSHN